MNFCKRSFQPILHYLYIETIKRGGEISLHKHFKNKICGLICCEFLEDLWVNIL